MCGMALSRRSYTRAKSRFSADERSPSRRNLRCPKIQVTTFATKTTPLLRLIRNKPMPFSAPDSCPIPRATRETISLLEAGCGERLRVVDLKRDCATSDRLRELGFCESAEVF